MPYRETYRDCIQKITSNIMPNYSNFTKYIKKNTCPRRVITYKKQDVKDWRLTMNTGLL